MHAYTISSDEIAVFSLEQAYEYLGKGQKGMRFTGYELMVHTFNVLQFNCKPVTSLKVADYPKALVQ